jgi:hypothetical protein
VELLMPVEVEQVVTELLIQEDQVEDHLQNQVYQFVEQQLIQLQ